ncbi:MAG: MBL fold metallo-hydrolase [bacterium]|nr:MBL fold metallo-hydrolase [bacterium]
MEVVFIGTGVGLPSKKRGTPGLLVKIGDEHLLFDLGPGIVRKILEEGFDYNEIDYIFYTHLHVDHVNDLPALLFAAKSPLALRKKDLHLVGPKGLKDFYTKLLHLYGEQLISSAYNVFLREMEDDVIEKGDWKITTRSALHTEHSIGYRIEDKEGKVVVYSGDTDYTVDIVKLAKNAHLLILECSFPNDIKVEGHLTPNLAGQIAKESKCERLILTHLYPVCDQHNILEDVRKVFRGQITVAYDGLRITI